jgi:hypothetical protein
VCSSDLRPGAQNLEDALGADKAPPSGKMARSTAPSCRYRMQDRTQAT